MQKLLFVAQNLCMGGVQKALVNTLNRLSADTDCEMTLFSFAGGVLEKEVPSNVRVVYGKRSLRLISTPFAAVLRSGRLTDIIVRIYLMLLVRVLDSERLYRSLFRKESLCREAYDVGISYFTDVPNQKFNQGTNLFVSDYVLAKKKLAWVHSDPILAKFDREHCRERYSRFDRVVCVSRAVEEKLHILLPELAGKTAVVHNMFPGAQIVKAADAYDPFCKSAFDIVTVCRVDNASKRIGQIVELCKRLKAEGIDGFHWYIVGDGPDLKSSVALAAEAGLSELLIFEGEKENPYPYIKKADLFALYSAYEGFPMVIGEAQILGTYILTTNYAAAREQIKPHQGYIAETDAEFYQKLRHWIQTRTVLRSVPDPEENQAENAFYILLSEKT